MQEKQKRNSPFSCLLWSSASLVLCDPLSPAHPVAPDAQNGGYLSPSAFPSHSTVRPLSSSKCRIHNVKCPSPSISNNSL